MYGGEMKTWNWKTYMSQHVKYHIILKNLKENKYQHLNPGIKVCQLLNGIRWEMVSVVVAAVKAHPDKYVKDFDAVTTFFTSTLTKKE